MKNGRNDRNSFHRRRWNNGLKSRKMAVGGSGIKTISNGVQQTAGYDWVMDGEQTTRYPLPDASSAFRSILAIPEASPLEGARHIGGTGLASPLRPGHLIPSSASSLYSPKTERTPFSTRDYLLSSNTRRGIYLSVTYGTGSKKRRVALLAQEMVYDVRCSSCPIIRYDKNRK